MLRIAIIFALFFSLLLLLRGTMIVWQDNPLPTSPEQELQPAVSDDFKMGAKFNIPVPEPLPDLNKNYIFNVDRLLELAEEPLEPEGKEGKNIGDDINIDIESVSYMGSIISKDINKAIISYSPTPSRGFAARRSARDRGARAATPASNSKYATLETGDTFNGYAVKSIAPDKIVFARDEEKIEKFLHDPEKKRLASAQPAKAEPQKTPEPPSTSRRVTVGRPAAEENEEDQPQAGMPPRRRAPRPAPPMQQPGEMGSPSGIVRTQPQFVPPPGQPPPSGSTTGE